MILFRHILDELKRMDSKMPVRVSDGTYICKDFSISSCHYSEVSFGCDSRHEGEKTVKTVGDLIDLLEDVKKQGEMLKNESGESPIDYWTSVVIRSEKGSGREIWDIVIKNETIYLVVGEYQFIEEWHD